MTSLFDSADRTELLRRLETLPPDAPREWGKMTAPQMLAHCRRAMEMALGERQLKRAWIGRLFGGMAKRRYVAGSAPFPHGSPTDPSLVVTDASDFERERAGVIELVQRISDPAAFTSGPHPFFGPMTPEEWDRLTVKHLDHHLRQFGG